MKIHPKTHGELLPTFFEMPKLGTRFKKHKKKLKLRKYKTSSDKLPESFTYRPEDLTETRDQGKCGSCWAFAIATVIADRIKLKHKIGVPLSTQNLLDCHNKSCEGADIDDALHTIPRNSYIPEKDSPYLMKEADGEFGKCIREREDYHAEISRMETYRLDGSGKELIRNMKAHIYHDGPIVGAMFEVYPDFMNYDGVSVYTPKKNQESQGGHAIEILGWGKNEDGIEYWICRNSWGNKWPAKHILGNGVGWFYIRMGVNASKIEETAYAILPKVAGDHQEDQINRSDEPASVRKSRNITILILIVGIIVFYYLKKKKKL